MAGLWWGHKDSVRGRREWQVGTFVAVVLFAVVVGVIAIVPYVCEDMRTILGSKGPVRKKRVVSKRDEMAATCANSERRSALLAIPPKRLAHHLARPHKFVARLDSYRFMNTDQFRDL